MLSPPSIYEFLKIGFKAADLHFNTQEIQSIIQISRDLEIANSPKRRHEVFRTVDLFAKARRSKQQKSHNRHDSWIEKVRGWWNIVCTL